MKTLLLLRHAKSNWGSASISDFDRTLNDQGRMAAVKLGETMKEEGLAPDLIISSPAQRTRETLECLEKGFDQQFNAQHPKVLYLASRETIFNTIRNSADSSKRLMIIGHNPGLHSLAVDLVKTGGTHSIENLEQGFPSGAMVEIIFSIESWINISTNEGRLSRFIKPGLF